MDESRQEPRQSNGALCQSSDLVGGRESWLAIITRKFQGLQGVWGERKTIPDLVYDIAREEAGSIEARIGS
jgi:hypothetical protein